MKYTESVKKVDLQKYAVNELCGINVRKGKKSELLFAENMSCDGYPSLKPRGRRATVRSLSSVDGIFGDDTLAYVENGRLYYGAKEISGLYLTSGEKTILRQGKYLMIFPDEVYCNLQDSTDFGSLNAEFSGNSVKVSCVNEQLEEISYDVLAELPTEAESGSYCAVKKTSGELTVKHFDGLVWNDAKVYIRLFCDGIGVSFRSGDTASCVGLEKALGTEFKIAARQTNALYVDGMLETPFVASGVTVSRRIPLFDYVAVSGGRLVGVRRGRDKNGELVCRIYGSAVGDPFNFSVSAGAVMLDVDISGVFCGVCDYLGAPLAFSESEVVETRFKGGALIGTVIRGYGLEKGASKSIAVCGGVAYYKSKVGVCRYDGSYPECISAPIGQVFCSESGSPAAVVNGKYYIKLSNILSENAIFVYDIDKKIWQREDDPLVKAFAVRGTTLYALCENGDASSIVLWDYDGASEEERFYLTGEGYPIAEDAVKWYFESAELGLDSFGGLYPVRLTVKMKKPKGSAVSVGISYDGEVAEGFVTFNDEISSDAVIPITSSRCGSLRLCVSGEGDFELLGYSFDMRKGGIVSRWK